MSRGERERLRKVDVPVGKSGDWKISRFRITIKEADFHNLKESIHGGRRTILAGVYTKLTHSGKIIMSDTPAELEDHMEPARRARDDRGIQYIPNRVLINGLGLGVLAQACLDEPTVAHVTVVEKSSDVLALVGPHYEKKYGDRLTIVHADALDWKPPKGRRYCVVWHDIWSDIRADNLPEMHRLHRKYGRRCDWQGSWCRWTCEQMRCGSFSNRCV